MRKIAFSGTHGTGKTTAVLELARQMKIDNPNMSVTTLSERSSLSPLPINTQSTQYSQLWIFTSQIAKEIELGEKFELVITDRSIVDSIAYSMYNGFNDVADGCIALAKSYLHTYDKIIYLTAMSNMYVFNDGIRDTTNEHFRDSVDGIMYNLYTDTLKDAMKGVVFEVR